MDSAIVAVSFQCSHLACAHIMEEIGDGQPCTGDIFESQSEDAAVAGVQSRVKLDPLKYDTQTDYTELGHVGHENS